jgi:hypothetical protein
MQDGMELVDAEGRRWRVLSIRRTGRAGPLLGLLWIFGPPQSRIEHDLEPLTPLSLAEVQQRTRNSVETYSADYMDGDDDSHHRSLLDAIPRTRSVSEIYDLLQPDTFESY